MAGWKRSWIKLWVEMVDDPKVVVSLDPGQRWVWVGLLLVAARSPEPGRLLLPSGRPMNTRQLWHATKSQELAMDHFEATLITLEEHGMVAWNGDCLVVTHWHERQDPETAAQRMQRYRAKQRGGNGHTEEVTPPVTRRNAPAPEALHAPLQAVTPPHTPPARGEEGQKIRRPEAGTSPDEASGLRAEAAQQAGTERTTTEDLSDPNQGPAATEASSARASSTVRRSKRGGNPQVDAVLGHIQSEWGQKIAFWDKEARWAKKALALGYTQAQILDCWRAAQQSPRWNGQWMPMASLLEDLGEFVKGGGQPLRKWGGVVGRHPEEVDRKEYLRRYGHLAPEPTQLDGEGGA